MHLFQASGVVLGFSALVLAALASAFTVDLLVLTSNRTGKEGYEEIGKKAYGNSAQVATVALIAVITWLVLIAYTVLIGDLLVPTFEYAGFHVGDTERKAIIIMAVILCAPMYFQRNLSALWFSGIVAIVSVAVSGSAIMYEAYKTIGTPSHIVYTEVGSHYIAHNLTNTGLKLFPDSLEDAVNVFPVFGVAFLCHFNILPINSEIQRPTRQRIRTVITNTIGLCTVVYILVGFSGMIFAGRYTCGNILLNFSPKDTLIAVARVCLSITLMCSYPMLVVPCRTSFQRLYMLVTAPSEPIQDLSQPLNQGNDGEDEEDEIVQGVLQGDPTSPGGIDSDEGFSPSLGEETPDSKSRVFVYEEQFKEGGQVTLNRVDSFRKSVLHNYGAEESGEFSTGRHVTNTLCVVLTSMVVALYLEAVMVVWTVMGATACFMIAFILPCLFYLKLTSQATSKQDSPNPNINTPTLTLTSTLNLTLSLTLTQATSNQDNTSYFSAGKIRRGIARFLLYVSCFSSFVCTIMVCIQVKNGIKSCPE